jgi:DNA modification methylase
MVLTSDFGVAQRSLHIDMAAYSNERSITPEAGVIVTNNIYNMDCLDGMKGISDGSVDMVLTSPPYDNLRSYKGYSFDFEGVAKELARVVTDGGVVVWVVGDATVNGSETGTSWKQALFFKELGFNIHDTMLYHKVNYVPLTHRRYEQCWEYMFCFSKGTPKTFNPIRIPCVGAGSKSHSGKFYHSPDAQKTTVAHKIAPISDTKLAPNIFSYVIGSEKTGHPAVFPLQLAKDQILSWTNGNDVVLDPFMGSGTTAIACRDTGRRFLGFEISDEYVALARQRLDVHSVPPATVVDVPIPPQASLEGLFDAQ